MAGMIPCNLTLAMSTASFHCSVLKYDARSLRAPGTLAASRPVGRKSVGSRHSGQEPVGVGFPPVLHGHCTRCDDPRGEPSPSRREGATLRSLQVSRTQL